jgi:hypothetical protein
MKWMKVKVRKEMTSNPLIIKSITKMPMAMKIKATRRNSARKGISGAVST